MSDDKTRQLGAQVANMLRVGVVSVRDDAACRVRVTFPDRDNVQSNWLAVMVRNTLNNSDYWMPEEGENVLCAFLPIGQGLEMGFVLGGFYVDGMTLPASVVDVRAVRFQDGGRMEYNRATGTATVVAPTQVMIDAPSLHCTGDITSDGDMLAGTISLRNHLHMEQGDGAPVSPPIP